MSENFVIESGLDHADCLDELVGHECCHGEPVVVEHQANYHDETELNAEDLPEPGGHHAVQLVVAVLYGETSVVSALQ